MPDQARFALHRRDPELIATLTIRSLTGDRRLDTNTTITLDSGIEATVKPVLEDLVDHGIIRPLRSRNGATIRGHRVTKLGLAWWQGRTTLPVPRNPTGTWEWWTPTSGDLSVDARDKPLFIHPDEKDDYPIDEPPLTIVDTGEPDLEDLVKAADWDNRKPGVIVTLPPLGSPPPPSSTPTS